MFPSIDRVKIPKRAKVGDILGILNPKACCGIPHRIVLGEDGEVHLEQNWY